ncbi:hypothetical protein ACRAWF_41310 [Streptomyces sp. L7]
MANAATAPGQIGRSRRVRGQGEPLGPGEGGVLVLDVDGHVRVDLGEGAQELGPVGDVVADADGDELPRRVLGPGVAGEAVAGGHAWVNDVSIARRGCSPRRREQAQP